MARGDLLATSRIEWILAVAAVITRLGALTQLVLAASVLRSDPSYGLVLAIGVGGATETLWYVATCWRARRVTGRVAGVDGVALLLLLGLPVLVSPQVGESPYFNVVTPASITLGLADWPVIAALGSATALAILNAAPSLVVAHTTYPAWNAVADGLGIVSAVTVATVVAALARRSARETDRERAEASARAGDLARERERLRQATVLRHRLVSTVDALARPGAIRDEQIAAQLRKERRWLRALVEPGDAAATAVPDPLAGALRELAAEKGAAGLRVRVKMPELEPVLDRASRDALVDAVREALTNVAKHAATDAAEVGVSVSEAAVVVLVTDRGRGYDPAVVTERIGQSGSLRRRMADAGGPAEIESTPGLGTTVRLTLPGRAEP